MRMRSRRPVVAMNVRWLFTLFLLTALFYLQDAASEDSRDGKRFSSDKHV